MAHSHIPQGEQEQGNELLNGKHFDGGSNWRGVQVGAEILMEVWRVLKGWGKIIAH